MNKNIKSIGVIGAGTAGLVTALILKGRLNVNVDVIYSNKIGIIGVGEGSTEHWNEFMEFVGITQADVIKECDATYKCGIMFDGWSADQSHKYLHSVSNDWNEAAGQYFFLYPKAIIQNHRVNPSFFFDNELSVSSIDHNNYSYPFNQYHFNTHKLNDFLIRIARSRGINIVEDDIEDVTLAEDGSIKKVKGEKSEYFYDFYIDSTGFKRILMEKLGSKWKSYSKYLKLNSAFVFPTDHDDENNLNLWTLAKAMKNGWRFKIPVWGRCGNGYIYDNNHTTKDEALKEVEQSLGKELQVGKEFSFDPGCLDRIWIKNCCAVGLSGSFVEPLEATSIGTSIQQAFLLSNALASYGEKEVEQYNRKFDIIMTNIRDYVLLHYLTDRKDTEFWREATSVELPDTLSHLLDMWKRRLPRKEDIQEVYSSRYIMFWEQNFIQILHGINYFDKESLQREFDSYGQDLTNYATGRVNSNLSRPKLTITHKKFIQTIRELGLTIT